MQNSPKICKNFLRGFCVYENRCKFLHVLPAAQHETKICNFFAQGYCKFGSNCHYVHSDNNFPQQNSTRHLSAYRDGPHYGVRPTTRDWRLPESSNMSHSGQDQTKTRQLSPIYRTSDAYFNMGNICPVQTQWINHTSKTYYSDEKCYFKMDKMDTCYLKLIFSTNIRHLLDYRYTMHPFLDSRISPRVAPLCSQVRLVKGTDDLYKIIRFDSFTKNGKDFYMMPDCTDKPFYFLSYIKNINDLLLDAYESEDFSEVVRAFFLLYRGKKDFIEKLLCCNELVVIEKGIGKVIQKILILLSQPTVNDEFLLQFGNFVASSRP